MSRPAVFSSQSHADALADSKESGKLLVGITASWCQSCKVIASDHHHHHHPPSTSPSPTRSPTRCSRPARERIASDQDPHQHEHQPPLSLTRELLCAPRRSSVDGCSAASIDVRALLRLRIGHGHKQALARVRIRK
jgi:hypothetical protein